MAASFNLPSSPIGGRIPYRKQPLQGMQQTKAKITALQQQYGEFQKQRQQDIAHLITTLDLSDLDDERLVGGLLLIKDKTASQDAITEVWRDAGERFLRHPKPRKHRPAQQAEAPSPKAQSSKKSS